MIELTMAGVKKAAERNQRRALALDLAMRDAVAEGALFVWSDARDKSNWADVLANPTAAAGKLKPGALKRVSVRRLARRYGRPLPPPGPLRALTGMLMRSIAGRTEKDGTAWVGSVGTRLAYAKIHELGGTIEQQRIGWRGDDIVASSHTIRIPPRPYLGPALERQRAQVTARLNRALGDALGK